MNSVIVDMNTAEQCKALGFVVGDTIFGKEVGADYWSEIKLKILWIGKECVVFDVFRRNNLSENDDFSYIGEDAEWTLAYRNWVKI